MTDKERLIEVFTRYGYLEVDAMEPDELEGLLEGFYIKWKKTGRVSNSGEEIIMWGCYTDVLEALIEYWSPYGGDGSSEEKEEMIEWMDDFNEI